MEDIDEYISTHVVVPGKDSILVITKLRVMKRNHPSKLVGNLNRNPIIDTRIYELEVPYGKVVEEYLVNIIMKKIGTS